MRPAQWPDREQENDTGREIMAKAKLKSKPASKPADAGKMAGKTIMESAQQIWLAGLGAFSKAQGEGGKLFETLMREGSSLEQKTRKIATGTVGEVRGAVETGVTQVRERTQETWDKLEQVFENRVSRALGKLGVPGRKDLDELIKRVDELNREVRRLDLGKPAATLTRTFTSSIRRAKDDLSDLVKDIEDVQLAARESVKRTVAKVTGATSRAVQSAPKPAPRPAGKPAAKAAPRAAAAKKKKR
jgi:poly(hydroxyalkanoate) granule-associated protein